eukprot:1156805-Pelagomonas_calceolata.AAC.5
MPPTSTLAFPEHASHGVMSHASIFAGKWACGGVLGKKQLSNAPFRSRGDAGGAEIWSKNVE